MCGCRTLLKEALGSRTLWRFKSVLSCLGASSSCQIAVPELLGVQGLHQVVLLAVASVPYQSPLSYAQLAHVGVFCDRLGFGPPTLDDVTYWQPQYPHLALGFWQRVHTGVEKGPLGCTPCNQPLQSTTNKGLNDSEVQVQHTPLQDETSSHLSEKCMGHDKITKINPHFHTNVVILSAMSSTAPCLGVQWCTKATANVDLASVSALEPKGSATTHQTLHAIKKTGHDSMIRTSDVGWVQYSPFFHNNLPSSIMNLPSEMTLSKNIEQACANLFTVQYHSPNVLNHCKPMC